MKYARISGLSVTWGTESRVFILIILDESPPIPRGVTHGDELLYLFSTGVFNLSEPVSII